MTEQWRQETFARNYRALLARGVSRADAGRIAALAADHNVKERQS